MPQPTARAGSDDDVATRADAVRDLGHDVEVGGRTGDGPALDQPGRVEGEATPVAAAPGAEQPVGALLGRQAQLGDVGHPRVRLGALAVLQAQQVAVGTPGAEHGVDLAQVGEGAGDPGLEVGAGRLDGAHVDADRHPHDLLDPRAAGQPGRRGRRRRDRDLGGDHRFAWSIADCSEPM